MGSPEIDTSHLGVGEWECPFCDETKRVIQMRDRIDVSLRASLINHLRGTLDEGNPKSSRTPHLVRASSPPTEYKIENVMVQIFVVVV
jgi:hypothetical protein